jgi:hypothetical protein
LQSKITRHASTLVSIMRKRESTPFSSINVSANSSDLKSYEKAVADLEGIRKLKRSSLHFRFVVIHQRLHELLRTSF